MNRMRPPRGRHGAAPGGRGSSRTRSRRAARATSRFDRSVAGIPDTSPWPVFCCPRPNGDRHGSAAGGSPYAAADGWGWSSSKSLSLSGSGSSGFPPYADASSRAWYPLPPSRLNIAAMRSSSVFAVPALRFIQRLSDNRHVLDRGAFQRRSPCDLKVTPPVGICGLSVAFSYVERDRLAGPKPLVPRRAMDALQRGGLLVDPGFVADREPVDVQFLVSEGH